MREEIEVELKEEIRVEMREEIAVELKEEIRLELKEEIRLELKEEIRVEIKDGEFGIVEVGDDWQAAEDPPKQAKELKVKRKRNPGKILKDDRKKVQKGKKEDVTNILETGTSCGQLQETQFKCKQCEKTFTIKRELVRHRKIVHESETRMLQLRKMQSL